MLAFSIKLLGGIIIILSGTALGYSYGLDISKRLTELINIKQIFIMIQSDISYGGMSLGEIFEHVKGSAIPSYYQFYSRVEKETKERMGGTFEELWNRCILEELHTSYLNKKDKEEMIHLGKSLGSVDYKQQLALLDLYIETLNQSIEEIKLEKYNKQKMCYTMGVIGSLFIVILLF